MDVYEEAGKENEQTLANLSPVEEATSKDEVEIDKFLQEQKSNLKKTLNLPLSKFFISVRKQNGTEYEPGALLYLTLLCFAI